MNLSLCARMRPELKAFADGELPLLARLRVARHLKTCPDCQKELIQMQTLSEELKPSETETPLEPELRAKILAGAPVSNPVHSAETLRRRRRVARKKTVLALGAASILGGLLWVSAQNGSSFAPPPSESDSAGLIAGSPSADAPRTVVNGQSTASSAVSAVPPPSAAPLDARSSSTAGANMNRPVPPRADTFLQEAQRRSANATFSDGHVRAQNEGEASPSAQQFQARRASPSDAAGVSASAGAAAFDSNPSTGGYYNGSNGLPIVPSSRAVHREGSVAVAVADAEGSSDDVRTLVKNAGGFVANTALETGASGRRTSTLDCRVPVDKFETLVSKIGLLGTVTAKSLNGQDITAQVAQSGARRQALQQELSIAQARLAMKEKNAKKREAAQIFELRSDVREVRIQAAQARAQLETLQKYGNTSSLFVSLQDRAPIKAAGAGLTDSLGPSGSAAWNSFVSNARVPFQLLLFLLAYVPIWLPALLLWRKYGRKWLAE